MSDSDMRDRLRQVYATAMAAAHEGGSAQIHAGSDVMQWMKDECVVPDLTVIRTTCWGFPVVVAPDELGPDHLSVHVVTVIP